ncbi:2OG-Fe dioxygenase family protein [Gynuella sp.]|uniref:2OG-Fe dioxygenase family protein n=1 Tax=Gynuella sp. TaxID=2969146 RepID=UPI003D0EA1F8
MTEPVRDDTVDDPGLIDDLQEILQQHYYAHIAAKELRQWLLTDDPAALNDWQLFADSWHDLKEDPYMADGGHYRRRRHATFSALPGTDTWRPEPHQPHYQSLSYNPLNGGILRYYEPIADVVKSSCIFVALMNTGCRIFSRLAPEASWHIEAHQFRIDANHHQRGLPTPEGIHSDGVDFVMMVLINRHGVEGGISQIFDHRHNLLDEFTLCEPMSMAIVNDREILHGVTAIQQIDPAVEGYRDILVVTFKDRLRVAGY